MPADRIQRVLLAGATGYIGRAVAAELLRDGFEVIAITRDQPDRPDAEAARDALETTERRAIELTEPDAVRELATFNYDAVISCLASRTGVGRDAWAVDYSANEVLLKDAVRRGARRFVLLSAICVQRPLLAFQRAKLAFERALHESKLSYCVVRPTAFFKSLSGQIPRVRDGKPFLVFGDGQQTSCKPISERDLARFIVDRLNPNEPEASVRPVGGPGPAITPLEQAELLFELLGEPLRVRRVPIQLFDVASAILGPVGRFSKRIDEKAELARIGRYYATESMLLWNEETARYDAQATPEFGEDTLRSHYQRVLEQGLSGQAPGKQRMF